MMVLMLPPLAMSPESRVVVRLMSFSVKLASPDIKQSSCMRFSLRTVLYFMCANRWIRKRKRYGTSSNSSG